MTLRPGLVFLRIALFALFAMSVVFASSSLPSLCHAQKASADVAAIERVAQRGPVRATLVLTPAAPVIGDVIELILRVTAEPGVEVLMPEFGEALGRFEIVDFAPSEGQDENGNFFAQQRYRLQPARSGPQSIPPLRVEFVDRRPGQASAPEGEDAYEMLTERIRLEVKPMLAADAPLVLAPVHLDLGPRRTARLPWWGWTLVGLAVAGFAAPFVWRAWANAQVRRRQSSAYEVARATLDELLSAGRPDATTMDRFYVSLSLIVRSYLEDRFGLRSPELTTQEFLTEMGRSPDLARSHQRLLRDFLTQADLVKFAGYLPDAEAVGQSISSAERFLEETRNQVRSQGLGASANREVGHA
jgi:hypothetical protein